MMRSLYLLKKNAVKADITEQLKWFLELKPDGNDVEWSSAVVFSKLYQLPVEMHTHTHTHTHTHHNPHPSNRWLELNNVYPIQTVKFLRVNKRIYTIRYKAALSTVKYNEYHCSHIQQWRKPTCENWRTGWLKGHSVDHKPEWPEDWMANSVDHQPDWPEDWRDNSVDHHPEWPDD